MNINEMLSFAHRLADAAGGELCARFRTRLTPERKSDESPVTEADRAAEEAMRALIRSRFPEHGIFGEEAGRVNPDASLQWVLDPIDGTRAFCAGYPLFTTLIALSENGVPLIGIIDQPILRERWEAAGGQTFCNGKPARTRPAQMENAVLATTSTDYFTPVEAKNVARLRSRVASSVLSGDAYAYAMLADGQVQIVADVGMKPYDFSALAPIVQGAGGVITDWWGNPLSLESDGRVLATASAGLHAEALALLT